MSSRISAKASDAKATVSFNSDSEDEDDNSVSSRLSSSGEEDVSDVETVTFSVSLAPKNKGETADSARVADREQLGQSKDTKEAGKGATSPKSRSSPNKVEAADIGTSEYLDFGLKNSGKSSMEDAGDALKITKAKATSTERSRSPKITINDVDSAEVDTDVTGTEKVSKKTRGSSPRKIISDEANDDFNSYSTSASRLASERVSSPQKPGSDDEIEFSRKSSKVVSGLDFDETAAEEPMKHKSKSHRIGSGERDADRAKSPNKSSEERELSRAKSPNITGEIDENRAKSPKKKKKTSEDKDFLRETSPRISSKEGKRKSSKDGKAPDDFEANQDLDDAKESTKVKKTKKSKHSKQEDGKIKEERPAKVTADKADGEVNSEKTGERLRSKELSKTEDLGLFYGNNFAEDEGKSRGLNFSKYGLNPERPTNESESSKSHIDEDLEVSREIAKNKRSELNRSPEGGADATWLTAKATGKAGGAAFEGKTPMIDEGAGNERSSRDLNYLKLDDAAENAKERVNEDSDFTYRRKSMDDFIKRILAEAREEKLKQKQTATETHGRPDDQRNGDVQTEIFGKPPRWNGNAAAADNKETSNLDKRLASIEKRRFGGNDGTKGESSKVNDEDGKKQSVENDTNDLDVNLDEDLEEINRFLKSRKSAAARFDAYDDGETTTATTTNDHSSAPTAGKQRTSVADDNGEQTTADLPQPDAAKPDAGPKQPKTRKAMKKYGVELDPDDDDDDGQFLARFKRERDAMLSETLFSPRRRDETGEVVRERTRNVRVLVDQQVDIIQSMRTTSKSLDELEKEIREARQVCLDRQVRIEALEGALGAEYRAMENGSQSTAGSEGSSSHKDEMGRLRRQGKLGGESADEDGFGFRRRSGSVASVGSFGSAFGGGGSDLSDLVRPPPSGYRPQRGLDLWRAEFDADFQDLDRRRAGSVNRDHRRTDVNPFGPPPPGDDPARLILLTQRPARSRASIATSSPTLDLLASGGDTFLAKIRAKYSFLAPTADGSGYHGSSSRSQGASNNYGLQTSLDLKYARPRSSFDDAKLRTRDFMTSSMSPGTSYVATTHLPSYYSVRDSRSPSGGGGGGGFTGGASWDRMRRAQSVSEFSFDRPSFVSGSGGGGGGGGEFHSRFLDKVRERKASIGGDEQTPATKGQGQGQGQGQDKPFKSRFLKTSSFDSTGSRSDRVTNGEGSEVTVDA